MLTDEEIEEALKKAKAKRDAERYDKTPPQNHNLKRHVPKDIR